MSWKCILTFYLELRNVRCVYRIISIIKFSFHESTAFQDLELYANSYTGLARLYRLMFIAEHCPALRVEALRMAIANVMNTFNVSLYQTLHKKLVEASA